MSRKRSKYKAKASARSTQVWSGLQSLTSLLGRSDGAILKKDGTEFISEDIAAFQIANKYKI